MVSKQVHVTPEQNRLLKERAKLLGVSESQLVRQWLQEFLDELDRQELQGATPKGMKRGVRPDNKTAGRT